MQQRLFSTSELFPFRRFKKLFSFLPYPLFEYKAYGRRPYSKEAILKAFIYSGLRRLNTLSELSFELSNNRDIAEDLGFNILRSLPSVERFSAFLQDTDTILLQSVRSELVHKLIECGLIKGSILSIDSCPIISPVKENNLKTMVKNRFDKYNYPPGDPESRLGVIIHFPQPNERKLRYFWGYKNHCVIDAESELPVWEITRPANVHETKICIPEFRKLQKEFSFTIKAVAGDSSFDTEKILSFIKEELCAKPVIAKNPRNQGPDLQINSHGKVVCIANLEMACRGTSYMKDKKTAYKIFVCPLHHYKKLQKKYIWCPMNHPKFSSQKGCCHTIRVDDNVRHSIDYDSARFKAIYKKRSGSERVFSRLLSICMQNITTHGLNAVANRCTIAHITVLLVALAAYNLGYKDKTRFVKTFVPNFLCN